MLSPIEKLQKFIKLESERGYDNRAVVGGLDKILPSWEREARAQQISDEVIQAVLDNVRAYPELDAAGRAEQLARLMTLLQTAKGTTAPVQAQTTEPRERPAPNLPNGAAEFQRKPHPERPMPPQGGGNRAIYDGGNRNRGAAAAIRPADNPATAGLNAPLTVIQGIGNKHAETLAELGLRTLGDLLYYFPRRYDDYSNLKPINRLVFGDELTIIGTVKSAVNRPIRGGQSQMTDTVISDGTGFLRVTWFNQPWLLNKLTPGSQVVLSGKIEQYLGRLIMNSPDWEPLEQEHLHTNRIVPVYPLTAGVTQRWLRKIMYQTTSFWAARIPDYLPVSTREAAGLMDLSTALTQAHFPASMEKLKAARDRLAFDEIFLLQMGVLRQKRSWQAAQAQSFPVTDEWLDEQVGCLPFRLTNAQQEALASIRADLTSGRPMNRLLQGDVGSGKTVVAALAAAMVMENGAQVAVMAPTSILAEQHYRSLSRLLAGGEVPVAKAAPAGAVAVTEEPTPAAVEYEEMLEAAEIEQAVGEEPVETLETGEPMENLETPAVVEQAENIEAPVMDEQAPAPDEPEFAPKAYIARPEQIRLLVGDTPEAEKEEIRAGLADGSIRLVIGTHALIEDPVVFQRLQLAVIDEQHRFGVAQRSLLRSKGDNPHLLVMTATPIPRSLALTVYGDLDLSVMDEMPAGRQPVETHVLNPLERERAYHLINTQIKAGHQAFIIYPLVEAGEREGDGERAAVEEHQRLQTAVFPRQKIGLLHGRLKPEEKEEVMARFRDREYAILVSTSVVEVGVDVPNATVMLVEAANRFGLAQLHQFRGRVGRGTDKSYCLLIPDNEDKIENERLMVMAETNDGFVLAERDLQQRGPGDFLGTRQAGFAAELKMANLTDVRLIEKAREQAQALFAVDPELSAPDHEALAKTFQRFWSGGRGDIS